MYFTRYYTDTMQINTETCNLSIPIHAFPVLDRDGSKHIFPEVIDFGKVEINTTAKQVIINTNY